MLRSSISRSAAIVAALVLLNFSAPVASAQEFFADVIPANCVLYLRDEDPVGRFEKLTGSGDIWSNPKKVSAKTKRTMDKAFKQADKRLEKDEGTLDSWLRSIGAVEVALFSLNFDKDGGDPFPVPEFAVSFESPAAIEMFNTFGKMMVDQGQATRNERGDLVLGLGFVNPILSIQGSRVIIASSDDRLSSIVSGLKAGRVASPLSSDPTYRACIGESASPTVIYVRFGALLQLIRDTIPERAQQRMTDIITPLGLTKITGIGYHEEGGNGIVIAKGSEAIPAFKLLKGKQGPPGVLEKMPADCVFAIGRTDELGPHLQRIQKFLTDLTFPFHKEVGDGIEMLTSTTGLKLDQILAPLKGGVVFAGVPDETGKIDDENAFVIVAKVGTREEALSLFSQMKLGIKSGGGTEMEQTEADGMIWLRPKKAESRPAGAAAAAGAPDRPAGGPPAGDPDRGSGVGVVVVESRPSEGTDSRAERQARVAARRAARLRAERGRPTPVAVWAGDVLIAGMESAVNRTLAAQKGQAPTLGTAGAFKKLPPQATFYMTSSLRSMFSQTSAFSSALSMLKDFGNTGNSVTVEDDMITFVANRTGSEQVATVMAAGLVGEDGRDERGPILDLLREIGDRTKAFHEKNKKWPASMADLGYTSKDMPSAKDSDGKPQAIVFLPPKATANPDDYQALLAYYPSNDFGRLAVSMSGAAWTWSESDFLGALARYNSLTK